MILNAIRGGLAELGQNIISRANTNFSLWSKEIAHPDGQTHSHTRLEVREILSRNPKEPPESSTATSGIVLSVLTRCQTLDLAEDQSGLVLFSSRSPTASSRVSNIKGIAIGKEVHIWEPWSEATIATTGARSSTRREKVILCSRFMIKLKQECKTNDPRQSSDNSVNDELDEAGDRGGNEM